MPMPREARAPERYPMRVVWADTDASGRIHNTAAFRWAEIGEHNLMRGIGLTEIGNFPRRHLEATYHRPLRFADEFELVFGVERVGRTSVTYVWQAVRAGELCIEGRSVIVHVDDDGRPSPLSDALRVYLECYVPASENGLSGAQ